MARLRVLELYSGIGGMHCALKGKLVADAVRNKVQTLFVKTRVRAFGGCSSSTGSASATSCVLGAMTSPCVVLCVNSHYWFGSSGGYRFFLASLKTHKSIREQIRFPCGSVFIHDGRLQEVIPANRTCTSAVGGASPPAGTCSSDVAVIFVGLY